MKLTLQQTVGAQATGSMELGRRRLEVRLGYGLSAFGDRFTSTPELGLGLSGRGPRLQPQLAARAGAGRSLLPRNFGWRRRAARAPTPSTAPASG